MSTASAKRVAIVTGAGRGIGEAIARRLSSDGLHVVVADISFEAAENVAAGLEAATPLAVDVRSHDDFAELIQRVRVDLGGLDVLVNNAAITLNTNVWEIEQSEWDDVLAVNLRGVFFGCQLAGPVMRDQRQGRIVNLTSLAGQQGGLVAGAHYAASKAGIIVLTKIFARELAPHGVTANAVAPAAIDGPLMQALTADRIQHIAQTIPVQRVGRPAEVAAVVSLLCSEDAGYITGATVDINGGVFMR